MLEKAKSYAQELNCSLIVTSRKINILKGQQEGIDKYELLPFEFCQVVKLLEKFIQDKNSLDILKNEISKLKNQLVMVPLSLMLILEVREENKEIPSSITELYDRFTDMALGRWDKEKGIDSLYDYLIKKKFICSLAYNEFLIKNRLIIDYNEYNVYLKEYINYYGFDMSNIDTFTKEIERSGILFIGERVYFQHRTFLDYFTANYCYDKRSDIANINDKLVDYYFSDMWDNTVFFYIGLLREISKELIERILGFQSEELSIYIDKMLIGRLLQAGWHSPKKIKYECIMEAILYAPKIRDIMNNLIEEKKIILPKIFSDLILIPLADFSFCSTFLIDIGKEIMDQYLEKINKDNIIILIILLWGFKQYLTNDELNYYIDNIWNNIAIINELNTEEQGRILTHLKLINQDEKVLGKKINKKLRLIIKADPKLLRKLFLKKKIAKYQSLTSS